MRVAAVAVLAALSLAGCGSRSADLFEVDRTGSIPGADLRLVISDDGRARCNGGPDRDITSDQLIDARQALRDLQGEEEEVGPADRRVNLAPGPNSILRYRIRVEGGSVAFSDTSRRQPPVFYKLAQLVRGIARGACGLAR